MTSAEATDQRRMALRTANRNRLAACDVRQEVRTGVLSVPDALEDPRAQPLALYRLLSAAPRWGTVKTEKFCRRLAVSPGRRVRDLTDRQRVLIAEALERS